MASLFLQYSDMASVVIAPSSAVNFLNQKFFFVASKMMTYSASMVESAMMLYLKHFQLTALPLQTNTYPDIDFLSSGSDMKSESV